MQITTFKLLVGISLVFAVIALIPAARSWPLVPIAVLLLCVALLVGK